jgi:hypothetical protein
MTSLDSQKPGERFGEIRKASVAYGDEFLTEMSQSGQPYPGAWNIEDILPQPPLLLGEHLIRFVPTPAVNQEGREVVTRRWPEKKDPFTQADLLDSEEDQIMEVILRIRASQSISYGERLANRLLTLFNDAKEEDHASLGIAVGSLRNFYNFLKLPTTLKCPIISLTPEKVPEQNHIARFCRPMQAAGGQIQATAFMLRVSEESLSVNWLEFLNCSSREREIAELILETVRETYSARQYPQVKVVFLPRNQQVSAYSKPMR